MSGSSSNTGGGQQGSRTQKESKADQIANRLKLSKDQKSEFETVLESTQKEAEPMVHQVLQSRQDMANALLQGKSDADIEALTKAMGEAQFQMTGVEVKTFQKIVALLKPNQIAKAPEAFDLMADIFLPPLNAGGRGHGR